MLGVGVQCTLLMWLVPNAVILESLVQQGSPGKWVNEHARGGAAESVCLFSPLK